MCWLVKYLGHMSDQKRLLVTLGLVGLIVLGVVLLVADRFGATGAARFWWFVKNPDATDARTPGKILSYRSNRRPVTAPDIRETADVRADKALGIAWAQAVLAGLSNPALTMSHGITTPADHELIRRVFQQGSKKVFRYGFIDPKGVLVLATRPDQLGKVVVSETALAALKRGVVYAYPAQDIFTERRADAATLSPTVVVLVPAFDGERYLGAVSVHVDARDASGL